MGKGKVDPLIVLDAVPAKETASSPTPAAGKMHKTSSNLPTSPSRRGGLGRLLSRRQKSVKPSHVKVPSPVLPPPEERVQLQGVVISNNNDKRRDKEKDESVTTQEESDVEDATVLEKEIAPQEPSTTTQPKEPLKVEIGTRYIPIEDEPPRQKEEESKENTIAFPSVDDLILQLAFLKESSTLDLSRFTPLVMTVPTAIESNAEEVPESTEMAGPGSNTPETEAFLEASRDLTTTPATTPLHEAHPDILVQFQMPEFLENVSRSLANMEACGWDCQEQPATPVPTRPVISFEEYEDETDMPVLLKSPNRDLDVFSVGEDEMDKDGKDNDDDDSKTTTRGLEVVLTLPEI